MEIAGMEVEAARSTPSIAKIRWKFGSSTDVGNHMVLTNTYALIPAGSDALAEEIQVAMGKDFPVIVCPHTANLGNFCVGNSHGLCVGNGIEDRDLQHIRNSLPPTVDLLSLRSAPRNCLGNLITANDSVALMCDKHLDKATQELVKDCLQVKGTIASVNDDQIGTYACLTNEGLIASTNLTEEDAEHIMKWSEAVAMETSDPAYQVAKIMRGSVNRGAHHIGTGMVCNDSCLVYGYDTTSPELQKILAFLGDNEDEDGDDIFSMREDDDAGFTGLRAAMIDSMVK